MGLLEGILYMIWRGFAIGVIISAPMGPVGILCVQRTLEKGRKTGFYTGIGAAISDLFYSLLTGFGLSFIEEFLERNSNIIQLLGSIVLIGFGIYLFRSNPSKNLRRSPDKRIPAGKNILNGFLFTVSNPLIIFLIIGLFARFNFMMPEIKFYHYMIGFLGIITGALVWWWVVTYFVDKVRSHFNLRSMWLINKIIGIIIFLFAVVGIITASTGLAKAGIPVKSEFIITSDSVYTVLPDVKKDLEVCFRIRTAGEQPRLANDSLAKSKYAKEMDKGWSAAIVGDTTLYRISCIFKDDKVNEIYSEPHLEVRLYEDSVLKADRKLSGGFNVCGGWNAFRIRSVENKLYFEGGNREYNEIFHIPFSSPCSMIRFNAERGSGIRMIDYGWANNLRSLMSVADDSLSISKVKDSFLSPKSKLEGVWGLYDYTVDDSKMLIGGEYVIAIVRSGGAESESKVDGYNIVYLSGSGKVRSKWRRGMIKGHLASTVFEDIFRMEWIDVNGRKIEQDIKAQFDAPFLNIQIPDISASIRFKKIENPKMEF